MTEKGLQGETEEAPAEEVETAQRIRCALCPKKKVDGSHIVEIWREKKR